MSFNLKATSPLGLLIIIAAITGLVLFLKAKRKTKKRIISLVLVVAILIGGYTFASNHSYDKELGIVEKENEDSDSLVDIAVDFVVGILPEELLPDPGTGDSEGENGSDTDEPEKSFKDTKVYAFIISAVKKLKLDQILVKPDEEDGGNEALNPNAPITPSYGISYKLNSLGTYYVVDGMGTCTDRRVVIPSVHNGLPVKGISDYAFEGNYTMEELYIGWGITSLGIRSFANCMNLRSVTIPSSVTQIGDNSFYGSLNLSRVNIKDIDAWCNISFESAESNPFTLGAALCIDGNIVTDLVIPSTVVKIHSYAFQGCTSIKSVTIPHSVTHIGDLAFYGCIGLERIHLTDGLNVIGENAFSGCTGILSITLPTTLHTIEDYAFFGCAKLVEIINLSSMNIRLGDLNYGYIAQNALAIHSDESIIVNSDGFYFISANGVNYVIGYEGNAEKLVLPESFNGEGYEIYSYAFANRSDLHSVTIPACVNAIGGYAFNACYLLTEVNITDIAAWCAIDFKSYGTDVLGGRDLYINGEYVDHLVIPEGVEKISNYAFYGSRITDVTLPSTLRTIGTGAFYECQNLKSLTIPEGVTVIENEAFINCSSIEYVNLPTSLTYIGNAAFERCDSISSVYYAGNYNSWVTVDIEANNTCLLYASRHYEEQRESSYSKTTVVPLPLN